MLTHSEPFKNKQTCLVFITNMKWHFSSHLGVQQELNSPTDPTDAEPEPSLEVPGCEQLWDVSVTPLPSPGTSCSHFPTADPRHQHRGDTSRPCVSMVSTMVWNCFVGISEVSQRGLGSLFQHPSGI